MSGTQWLELTFRGSNDSPIQAETCAIHLANTIAFLSIPRPNGGASQHLAQEVTVHALGQFTVLLPSGNQVRPRRPQALTMLKVLLCARDRVVTEEEMIASLWPLGTPRAASEALRILLHDLRQALEPNLPRSRDSRFVARASGKYFIPPDAPLSTDFDQFGQAVADGWEAMAAGRLQESESRVRQALDLYPGDLFEPDAAAAWFSDRRKQLRDEWVSALTMHAQLLARRADLSGAIRECERATQADFSHEGAHRLLILLLARNRGSVAASEWFVEMYRQFRSRFGVSPSRMTVDMVARLEAGESLDALERELYPLVRPSADEATT